MPPPIVYSGPGGAADTEGGLFAGKSFFITQRTPSRSRYVSDVETNGGRVVKLETQADYLIADDHALKKQYAPPGSLSFRLIEDAIKDGAFPEDISVYEIRVATSARPTGTTPGVKSSRTVFTSEDDEVLYDWVKNAEKKGIALKGNAIYRQLEEHNPRHTSQSWRDRWLKVVSRRPPPSPNTLPPASHPGPSDPSRRSRPVPAPATSTSREHFTAEDDEFLTEHVKAFAKQGYKPKGNEMFKEIAELNDRHSFQSWRNRWVKYLDPHQDLDVVRFVSPPRAAHAGRALPARQNSSPVKSTRTRFTDEDDAYLRRKVRELLNTNRKYTTKGNELFRHVEGQNNRHSYHSWKDRWLRMFEQSEDFNEASDYSDREEEPAAISAAPSTPPQPTSALTGTGSTTCTTEKHQPKNSSPRTQPCPPQSRPKAPSVVPDTYEARETPVAPSTYEARGIQTDPEADRTLNLQDPGSTFTDVEYQELLSVAADVQNVRVGRYHEAWVCWATEKPTHTADEWRSYYECRVLPDFLEKEEDVGFLKKIKGNKVDRRIFKTQGQPIVFKRSDRIPASDETPKEPPNTVPDPGLLAAEQQPGPAKATRQLTNPETAGETVEEATSSKKQAKSPEVQADQAEEVPDVHFAAQPVTHPERPLLEEIQAMNQYYGSHSTHSKPKPDESVNQADRSQGRPMLEKIQAVNQYYGSHSTNSKRKLDGSVDQTDQTQKRRRSGLERSNNHVLEDVPEEGSIQNSSALKSHDVDAVDSPRIYQEDDDIDEDGPAQQLLREMQFDRARPRLTEANLARAQAEQDNPKGKRGIDLIEDNEADDQEEYVGFLSNLMKENSPHRAAGNNTGGVDPAEDYENDGRKDHAGSLSGDVKSGLPGKAAGVASTNKQIEEAETGAPDHEQPQVSAASEPQPIDPASYYSSPIRQPFTKGPTPLDPDLSPLQAPLSQTEPPDYASNIHLDLAGPEGGWDTSSRAVTKSNGGGPLDTQQVLGQETQLDLEIPDPETQVSAADVVPDSQKLSDDEIEPYLHERTDAGYTVQEISEALRATCMNPKLADTVLETGAKAAGSGIWTEEEDEWVEGGDTRRLRQLEEKHGWNGIQRRLKFLQKWREDMMMEG